MWATEALLMRAGLVSKEIQRKTVWRASGLWEIPVITIEVNVKTFAKNELGFISVNTNFYLILKKRLS